MMQFEISEGRRLTLRDKQADEAMRVEGDRQVVGKRQMADVSHEVRFS